MRWSCACFENCDDLGQQHDALSLVPDMTTISIDEHRVHADGSAPFDIPTDIIPNEHALLRLTTELAYSVVENLRRWLSPADVPTQNDGICGVG